MTKSNAATKQPLVDLTPDEGRQLLNPRDGWEQHVEEVLTLYAEHQAVLALPAANPTEVRGRIKRIAELAAEEKAAEKRVEMLNETRRMEVSEVWGFMLSVYTRAREIGRTHPDIKRAIGDFEQFMKTGPRKPRAVK